MKQLMIFTLTLFFAVSCARGASSLANDQDEQDTIEMPEIPSNLKEPTDRADYLITHYWDRLDFSDTTKTHDIALMEQSFVNFLSILPYASSEAMVRHGMVIFLERMASDPYVFKTMTATAEDYLYNPNSPMLSEDIYLIYLDALKDSPNITETDRIRIEDKIEMASKNRKGTKAADFSFRRPDGSVSTLYKILNPKKQTMLIFFDPDCENCEVILEKIQANSALNADIDSGKIQILAVYAGDNENSWRKKASSLPAKWIVGINTSEIDDNELYFFPGLPTIYLIDGDGTVLGKDIQIN